MKKKKIEKLKDEPEKIEEVQMKIKFLKSIVEHLTSFNAVPIVDLLVGKKDVNEFLIAKKLDLTINQTRNILYKLSDFGLVSFIRKKDKKKGWYIYFWTLNVVKSLGLFEKKMRENLAQLEIQLKNRKEKRYYVCKTCNIESSEEVALLNNFICSECEDVYSLSENSLIIRRFEREIFKLKKELDFIFKEREDEEEKLEKKRQKKIEKEKKIKSEARKSKRKATAEKKKAEKEKLNVKVTNKKTGKKSVLKKIKGIAKKIKKKSKTK